MRIRTAYLVVLSVAFLAGSLSAFSISVYVDPCLIVKGQNCSIVWASYDPIGERVNVSVWYGSTLVAQFKNVPHIMGGKENTQVWHVPASAVTGKYKFRVTTIDGLVQGEHEGLVDAQGIAFAQPGPGGTLEMDSMYTVSWHAFGVGPSVSGVYIELYRSGAFAGLIGMETINSTHGCGRSYSWQVGHLYDADAMEPTDETVPAGSGYSIRIRQMSGSFYVNSGQFTISQNFDWLRDKFSHMRRIPVYRIPRGPDSCPMCAELQLQEFFEVMKSAPKRYEVELWASGKSLGRLIKPSQGTQPIQRIDFGNSFPQLEKGGSGFELRVFDARGRLAHSQAVTLQLSSKSPVIKRGLP